MIFSVCIILLFSVSKFCVYCYSFNTKDVILISDSSVANTYFSYKLLLQSGEPVSSLIVGAPHNRNNPQLGGDIYKCNIKRGEEASCIQYPTGRTISSNTTNGNFYGMSLDGDDQVNGAIIACAPRTITSRTSNYLRGYCVYMKNSSEVNQLPEEVKPLNNYGLYRDLACCDSAGRPYYDFAFAMAGFDVSFYSQKKKEVLFGAPGVKKFNGAAVSYSLEDQGINLIPTRLRPVKTEEDTYFGYSVTAAQFQQTSSDVWFVAGAPRANNLRGKVTIFFYDVSAQERIHIVARFEGKEEGSYFGAAVLALDVTNDKIVDIIVGVPMTAGKTWDEGSVFFYKGLSTKVCQFDSPKGDFVYPVIRTCGENHRFKKKRFIVVGENPIKSSFHQPTKLTGSSKMGSRFGSEIVTLGDFDLDGYNDIAISAPYEDDGSGAVYIYRGSSEGLTDQYSQRLSPQDFTVGGTAVKGFGKGLSRGNDIDGDGHNDIAIGAYKSDQVFIVKSYSIIDYRFQLNPSINTITNDTIFDLRFCLLYTKRSHENILPKVKFNLSMNLDYRAVEGKIVDHITVDIGETMCKEYAVQIRHSMADISPFEVDLKINTETPNIIAHGEKSLQIQIPYSHGCGSDNICETDLSLQLISNSQKIVLGLDKQIDLTVKVRNDGDPAYQCEVILKVPDGIELRNHKDCTNNEENYTCIIDERLIGLKEKDFIFDIKDIKPDVQIIDIVAQVTSLGKNIGEHKEKGGINIPIILENVPYIFGKSVPDNVELEIKNDMQEVEVAFQFAVGKSGPSPLEVDVDILLPIVEYNGENVFSVLEVKGTIDNIQIVCNSAIVQEKSDLNEIDVLKVPLNRTIVVSCNSVDNCVKYSCQGEYLYSSAQVAVFDVRVLTKSSLLVSKYKKELTLKDLVVFIPIAFQNSPIDRIGSSPPFLIFAHGVQYIPLWVYLVAPAIGLILLMGISFGLYKCHFFDRVYKDKLDQEKILESKDGSVEDEIFDDVVFRPMEDTKQKEYL